MREDGIESQNYEFAPQEQMETLTNDELSYTSNKQNNITLIPGPIVHMSDSTVSSCITNGQSRSRDSTPDDRNSVSENTH